MCVMRSYFVGRKLQTFQLTVSGSVLTFPLRNSPEHGRVGTEQTMGPWKCTV